MDRTLGVIYTVSQKKFPTLNYLQLCQILTDFQTFCTAGKRTKYATKLVLHTHRSLGTLLHYLEKLKIQIFCRYSAIIPDMEENANKLHFKCTNFNSSTCALCTLTVFMSFYQKNLVLVAEYHVDC